MRPKFTQASDRFRKIPLTLSRPLRDGRRLFLLSGEPMALPTNRSSSLPDSDDHPVAWLILRD